MNVQRYIRTAHASSVLISLLLNGLLFVVLFIFITFQEPEKELNRVIVIQPSEQEDIEELEEIEPEEIENPEEMDELTDFTIDTPMDTAPEPDPEPVEQPAQTDISSLASLVSDISSPVVMQGLLAGRTAAGRQEALRRHGGGNMTEQAVAKALEWLKKNQLEDGSWQGNGSAKSKTGMTGLALLTFLAHGETTTSVRYGGTVQAGLRFLVDNQREDGTFKHHEGGERGGVYANGIAAYALAEAYSMTRIPMLEEPLRKAVAHIIRGQREDGGFDYNYAQNGGPRDRCTSVAGWQIQAMKAARTADVGIPGLPAALERAASGMLLNQRDDHKFLYASGRPDSEIADRHIMTAIGVLCLQIVGQGQSTPVEKAMRILASATLEDYHRESEPVYAWYYATQAYFQTGGTVWKNWNRNFSPMAVENQNADGSWTWDLGRTGEYGPVYHTTLTALSLMVYYRYLPMTQSENISQPIDRPAMGNEQDEIQFEI